MDYQLEKETYTAEETKALLDKFTKSEADRVRTEYSRKLKAVEAERDALKPAEKSEAEIALDTRAAELSRREKALALREAGLAPELADLLHADADVSKLAELLNAGGGYQPTGHRQNGGLTREAFQAMPYSEQAKIYAENPNIIDTLL